MAGQIQNEFTKVGPGAYNVSDEYLKKSPKVWYNYFIEIKQSNIKFSVSKTQREDTFSKSTT